MQCAHCSQDVIEASVYCHHCGARLAEGEVPSSPQQRLRESAQQNENLTDEDPERELWQGTYSKLTMIDAWIAAAFFSVGLVVFGLFLQFTGVAWLAAVAVIFLLWLMLAARIFYLQLSRHYYLTNQHFIHESGLLWRTFDRIEVIDVNDVSFVQGPLERYLGLGTVHITSSDLSHPKLVLPGIENVRAVAKMIDDARRQERRKRGLHIATV